LWLEYITLAWNVAGVGVLAVAAVSARSVALAGFGLDSLIEILASIVVIWQLTETRGERERTATRVIGGAFFALAIYIAAQGVYVLAGGGSPGPSPLGIAWTAIGLSGHDSTPWTYDAFATAFGDRYRTVRVGDDIVIEATTPQRTRPGNHRIFDNATA
jgi:hypothetical protein